MYLELVTGSRQTLSIRLSHPRGEKCKIYHVNLHYSRSNRAPFFYRMIKTSLALRSTIPRVRIRTQITQYAQCRQEQSSTRHTSSSALRREEGEVKNLSFLYSPFFIPFASFAYSARVRSVPSIFFLPRSSELNTM